MKPTDVTLKQDEFDLNLMFSCIYLFSVLKDIQYISRDFSFSREKTPGNPLIQRVLRYRVEILVNTSYYFALQ